MQIVTHQKGTFSLKYENRIKDVIQQQQNHIGFCFLCLSALCSAPQTENVLHLVQEHQGSAGLRAGGDYQCTSVKGLVLKQILKKGRL